MLRIDNQNMTMNATSMFEDKIVATFNAYHDGTKSVNLNIYVEDSALLVEHKDMVNEDFIAFSNEVVEVIEQLNA